MTFFAVCPQSDDFLFPDDADYFTTREEAIDSAFDWSVSLHGSAVNVFGEDESDDGWIPLNTVFA